MKAISQRSISLVLLIALFLQSCGVEVPLVDPRPEEATASEANFSQGSSVARLTMLPDIGEAPELSVQSYPPQRPLSYVGLNQVTSTQALVKTWNSYPTTEEQRVEVTRWVKAYIDYFKALNPLQADSKILVDHLNAYKCLAHLRPTNQDMRDLLQHYFESLYLQILALNLAVCRCKTDFMQTLAYVTQKIDPSVLNVAQLINLLAHLMRSIDAKRTVFTAATYPDHAPTLEAIYELLRVIRSLDPEESWAARRSRGEQAATLYDRVQDRLLAIASSATRSYPVFYHAHLLLRTLEQYEEPMTTFDRTVAGLQGGLSLLKLAASCLDLKGACEGILGLASLSLDIISSLDEAVTIGTDTYSQLGETLTSFKHAFERHSTYYDYHQVLSLLSNLALNESAEAWACYKDFAAYVDELQQRTRMLTTTDLKALRYFIVRQLTLLSLHRDSDRIRQASINKLSDLGSLWLRKRNVDQDILHAVLDSLATIYSQRDGADETLARAKLTSLVAQTATDKSPQVSPFCLPCLVGFGDSSKKATPADKSWLGDKILDEKLAEIAIATPYTENADKDPGDKLLTEVESLLADDPDSGVFQARAKEMLRRHYQGSDFVTMDSLLGKESVSIEDMECHLKMHEQVRVSGEGQAEREHIAIEDMEYHLKMHERVRVREREQEEREHQLARREERLQWTKTPIDLADLFKARSLNPDGTVEEIKRVLLIGEPGTGKTALTKKIAYDWARGKWGLEFEAVYILPVRKLRGRNQGLAAAIVEEFLPEVSRTHGPSYNWWLDHVKALLQKPVTLVVLDGLDERYGVRQDVLEEAQNGSHKLLLTSRPYGIDDVMCKLADIANIQVEHMGLNDAQRDRFVHRVLAKSEGDVAQNLLAFIETHRLEEISRVPVNLQILCELWNNEQGNEIGSRSTRIGLPWLYRKMVDYIWERFEREGARRLYTDAERYYTFIDLGKIALKTLEKGEIIIRRTTIEDILGRGPSAVLQDTGLLKSVDRQYQFPHLTFHEYFAGRRLAVQFLPDKSRNGNQDAVREFLEEHMYKPEYRRALLFMVGEVTKGIPQELRLDSPRKHTEHIGSLLELVDEASVEHGENTEVQHLLLQLSLVNEWLLAADMREKEQGKALRELDKQFKFERSLLEYFNIGLYQAKSDQGKVVDLATLKDILSLLFASSNALVAHYGKRILSFIEQTLIDTKPSVRLSGVSILPSLTPDGMTMETVLGHLETSCSDGDAGVKAASCDALAVLTETTRGDNLERIFLQIKKILQGDESSVRESASRALSTFVKQADGQEIVLPLFKSALKDNNAYVRQGVLRALVDFIGSEVTLEEALSLIATDLKGNEVNTREAAVTTLVSLVKRVDGIEVLLPLCKQLLQDNDACIRKITLEVLPALTDRGAVAEAKSIFSDVKNTLDVSEVSHLLYSAAEKGHLEIVKHIYKENCEVDLEILDEDGCTPLYIAAQNGHLEIVQYLKEHGAKCDTSNNSGMTPVNIAAQNGHLAAIQYLKEQGVRLDTPNNEGMTSAHLSAQNGHLAVVTYLKDNGVRVDTPNENGITPIYLAVQNGHLEVVIYLNGIQVIIPNGITLLHYAALTGQVKIARYLVEQGAKVDALANNEMTPLHYAAFVGQVKVAKYLVEQGAKVDALANNEMTPLHCAALTGPVRVARYLVRHIDINDKNYMRLMHIAAQNGHIKLVEYLREQVYKSNKEDNALLQIAVQHGRLEVVKYFIRKVNRINTPDNNGWTAMHLAAHNGYLEIVTYLRDNGAQVDMAAKDDMTPLHLAAQNGHLPVVIYLQEQGGQVDAVSRNGMTPLHLAVENGHLPVVIYLQEHGGQVDAVSKNGMAPLHLAAQNGHSKVLMYLKDHGAYIETAMKYDYNNRGMTPLHLAAQNGHLMIVTYLVNDNKVNVNVHNSQYQTPLQLAKRNNHQAVVDFLETHGAQ